MSAHYGPGSRSWSGFTKVTSQTQSLPTGSDLESTHLQEGKLSSQDGSLGAGITRVGGINLLTPAQILEGRPTGTDHGTAEKTGSQLSGLICLEKEGGGKGS